MRLAPRTGTRFQPTAPGRIMGLGAHRAPASRGPQRAALARWHARSGAAYLAPFAPHCQRVDVQALLDAASAALREVERLGPDRLGEFDWSLTPRVRFIEFDHARDGLKTVPCK